MSLAAATRDAVDEKPFLVEALRAEICNYTAAARFLDVDGELDAVATALRRYASELPGLETAPQDVRVTMESGIEPIDDPDAALIRAGDVALGPGRGDRTAIVASGEIGAAGFANAIGRCQVARHDLRAASFVDDVAAAFVVSRRDGANALRTIEGSFDAVPLPSQ